MNVFDIKTHPAADIFPMLADDELHELASDIKENGLNNPIVVGDIGGEIVLIDGRNRRAACELSGINPSTVTMENPTDSRIRALIISENIHRRHMTKGQQAMAVALIHPEKEKGGRGNKRNVPNNSSGLSRDYIGKARTVLSNDAPLARSVLAGRMPLAKAYDEVREKLAEEESEEAKMQRVEGSYPDLAKMVREDAIGLDAALTEVGDRDRKSQEMRNGIMFGLRALVGGSSTVSSAKNIEITADWFNEYQRDYEKEYGECATIVINQMVIIRDGISLLIEKLEHKTPGPITGATEELILIAPDNRATLQRPPSRFFVERYATNKSGLFVHWLFGLQADPCLLGLVPDLG